MACLLAAQCIIHAWRQLTRTGIAKMRAASVLAGCRCTARSFQHWRAFVVAEKQRRYADHGTFSRFAVQIQAGMLSSASQQDLNMLDAAAMIPDHQLTVPATVSITSQLAATSQSSEDTVRVEQQQWQAAEAFFSAHAMVRCFRLWRSSCRAQRHARDGDADRQDREKKMQQFLVKLAPQRIAAAPVTNPDGSKSVLANSVAITAAPVAHQQHGFVHEPIVQRPATNAPPARPIAKSQPSTIKRSASRQSNTSTTSSQHSAPAPDVSGRSKRAAPSGTATVTSSSTSLAPTPAPAFSRARTSRSDRVKQAQHAAVDVSPPAEDPEVLRQQRLQQQQLLEQRRLVQQEQLLLASMHHLRSLLLFSGKGLLLVEAYILIAPLMTLRARGIDICQAGGRGGGLLSWHELARSGQGICTRNTPSEGPLTVPVPS